jgi:hypothetical protein
MNTVDPLRQTPPHESRSERDLGIVRITSNNRTWMQSALAMLPAMKAEYSEATGEDMRAWLLGNGLHKPTKPNAWGALTRSAIRLGIIADTGRVGQMAATRSHARRTPLWRFL